MTDASFEQRGLIARKRISAYVQLLPDCEAGQKQVGEHGNQNRVNFFAYQTEFSPLFRSAREQNFQGARKQHNDNCSVSHNSTVTTAACHMVQ